MSWSSPFKSAPGVLISLRNRSAKVTSCSLLVIAMDIVGELRGGGGRFDGNGPYMGIVPWGACGSVPYRRGFMCFCWIGDIC
jgi:hypothetical protein